MSKCSHNLLRRTTRGLVKGIPWDTIPIWECVDCGEVFDIIKED